MAAKRREKKKMEMQWTAELQSRKMGVKERRWHEEEISGRLGQCTGRHIRLVSGLG